MLWSMSKAYEPKTALNLPLKNPDEKTWCSKGAGSEDREENPKGTGSYQPGILSFGNPELFPKIPGAPTSPFGPGGPSALELHFFQ